MVKRPVVAHGVPAGCSLLVVVVVLIAGCATTAASPADSTLSRVVTTATSPTTGLATTVDVRPTSSTTTSTTLLPAGTSTSTSTSTTTSTTTSTSTTTTIVIPPPASVPPGAALARVDAGSAELRYLSAAVNTLVGGNRALAVSVLRDGAKLYGAAAGAAVDGSETTTDTAFVLASVSKLVTALSIARLAEQGRVDLGGPVPWDELGLRHDPAWNDVTVRELLAHVSGMPVERKSWLDLPGSCAVPLTEALAEPPRPHRGTWTYSNGNYCALGLLVEHITGMHLDDAARKLVFGPLGLSGPHLTTGGSHHLDAPYAKGLGRLDRLGGAGTWMASANDVVRMMESVTADDMETLAWPGIMIDQYGWGHTGTLDGAKACTWILDGGRTVIAVAVSGNRPATGSELCDALVPALAVDIGIYAGDPIRSPL